MPEAPSEGSKNIELVTGLGGMVPITESVDHKCMNGKKFETTFTLEKYTSTCSEATGLYDMNGTPWEKCVDCKQIEYYLRRLIDIHLLQPIPAMRPITPPYLRASSCP